MSPITLFLALLEIDALDPGGKVDGCSQAALRGLVLRMGEIARDALEDRKKLQEKEDTND